MGTQRRKRTFNGNTENQQSIPWDVPQNVSQKHFRIVLMATGAFAVPSMRLLCEEKSFDIVCLVTNPLRYDRHGNPIMTPAREFAAQYNIAVSDKDDIHSQEFFDFLYLVRPDLLFVCDFGHILPKAVLKGSLLGGINLHGSLLPKYRGAAPVHWAILNGEQYTGVSIIHVTPKVDAGPVIAQSPPIRIGTRENTAALEERLADYGAELVYDVVNRMAGSRTVKIIEQLHEKASKAPKLKKENGQIPWHKTAAEIFNHCRAMDPWPRSFTDWQRPDGSKLRLIIGQLVPLTDEFEEEIGGEFRSGILVAPVLMDAKMDNLAELLSEQEDSSRKEQQQTSVPESSSAHTLQTHALPEHNPGTILCAESAKLIVAAKDGAVRILFIQPVGKKMMPVKDFLQGYAVKQGDRLC